MQLVQSFYNVQNGLTYERYQQYFGVAQVLGAQVTLYIDDSGTIATVIGAHYPDIAPANFARLSGLNARAVVDRDIGATGNRNVDLLINPETGRPQNRGYWLQSGGNRQLTYDDGNNGGVANIMIDSDDHWDLVTPDRKSPGQPAGVDAHYYASVVDNYYLTVHGLNSFNNAGASMVSIVHIPDIDSNNAFWTGQKVVYGDGDGTEFREFSGALDVVGHEWTHAVTDYSSNLIYQNESGALNESFSDQMGTSIEFWANEATSSNCTRVTGQTICADWLVGEDIWMFSDETMPGLRNMANPAEYGDPDHYDERDTGTADNGGVHTNSGIPNHAFYLLTVGGSNAGETLVGHSHAGSGPVVVGIGLGNAQQIFYLAMTALSSGATMCNARAATQAIAAGRSSQQLTSTTDAWAAVGLTDSECGVTPPDTTAPETTITSNPSNPSSSSEATFVFTSSEGGSTFECSLDTFPFSSCTSPKDYTGLADGSHNFRVQATDAADNTDSTPASYVWTIDTSSPGEDSMHVQSIEAITVDLSKGYKKARATVRIVDSSGNPVGSANVTGEFTGDIAETRLVSTDGSGVAVLESAQEVKGRLKFTFCVVNVVGTLPYNSTSDVETCDSN